jgi:glutathione peroxidase
LSAGLAHAATPAAASRAGAAPAAGTAAPAAGAAAAATGRCPALLDHRQLRLQDEAQQDLCKYAGQVVLIVNTASFCGFTAQYGALEKLHARYQARGFSVLGFPSNDFSQEPGSNAEIAQFCESTYGVKFPMFAKSSVRGSAANPVFAQLAQASGQPPKWNFHKYLVGRDGRLVGSYASGVAPDDARLAADIEKSLAAR